MLPNINGRATFNFDGVTVLHTGSGSGIGLATTRNFLAAGARVIAVDTNVAALESLEPADRLIAVEGDVRSSDTVMRAVELAGDELSVLVNNAGLLRDRVLWKTDDDDWHTVVDVHLKGAFNFLRACAPIFRSKGYGRIINTTSYAGLHGNFGQSNYSAAKGGIIALTKTVAKELGRFGVTCNAISPNARTKMIDSIPQRRIEELEAATPLGRFSAVDEVFPLIAFLASAQAAYITGCIIPIDGGLAM